MAKSKSPRASGKRPVPMPRAGSVLGRLKHKLLVAPHGSAIVASHYLTHGFHPAKRATTTAQVYNGTGEPGVVRAMLEYPVLTPTGRVPRKPEMQTLPLGTKLPLT